jgi:hypothetical protein
MSEDAYSEALSRAIAAVNVIQCWERLLGDAPARPGLYKSPFRPDTKPSFSVFRAKDGGILCKDQADGGKAFGAWNFVKQARPQWTAAQIADWFFMESGVPRPERQALSKADRRKWLVEQRAVEAAAERRIYRDREKTLHATKQVDSSASWAQGQAACYEEGCAALRDTPARAAAIAKKRGWPAEWVSDLAGCHRKISAPVDYEGKRHVAFAVERPLVERGVIRFEPIGYHQRHFKPVAGGSGIKTWYYHPKGLPAYPFVIGNFDRPRVVAITEGQWDAITLWGSMGGLTHDAAPFAELPVAVIGLRGASSIEVFLGSYHGWLSYHKPLIWFVADSDVAGQRWRDPDWTDRTRPRPVSFVERVQAITGRKAVVSWIKRSELGKDYNDLFLARQPSMASVADWMRRIGVTPWEDCHV